jgi:hypothetical protein
MPKLKVFNCQQPERPSQETENLRKLMSHLEINVNQGVVLGGDLHIARPNESIEPEDGLWDIFVKSTELFPEKRQARRKWGGRRGTCPPTFLQIS